MFLSIFVQTNLGEILYSENLNKFPVAQMSTVRVIIFYIL